MILFNLTNKHMFLFSGGMAGTPNLQPGRMIPEVIKHILTTKIIHIDN